MNAKTVIITLIISGLSACVFAQKATTVMIGGVEYAAISSEGMPKGYEQRETTADAPGSIYYKTPLYTYSKTGDTPPQDATYLDPKYSWPVYVDGISGEVVKVNKIVRHQEGKGMGSYSFPDDTGVGVPSTYNPNTKISTLLAIAPTDIYDDGKTTSANGNSAKMNWATAAGFLISAHSLQLDVRSSATQKGCYMYRGKNGTDPLDTWRLPFKRELILMSILKKPLENTSSKTGFISFNSEAYWSATEHRFLDQYKQCHYVTFSDIIKTGSAFGFTQYRVRCVRDVPPPEEIKK